MNILLYSPDICHRIMRYNYKGKSNYKILRKYGYIIIFSRYVILWDTFIRENPTIKYMDVLLYSKKS